MSADERNNRREAIGFWLLIMVIAAIGVGKAVLSDALDPDLFWHIRVADQLKAEGIHPLVDHLSFSSMSEPWTPYSWLAELGMKWLWDAGGYRATVAAYAILVAALLTFVALACFSFAGPKRRLNAVVGVMLAAFLAFPFLSFRPVTMAIVLLATCAWLLLRDRRREEQTKAIWLVVPLTALITNIHLIAIVVPLWVGCLLAGAAWERNPRSMRRYGMLLIATTLACLATPMLPGAIRTAWHYQYGDVMVSSRIIAEMQPIWRGVPGVITIILLAGVAVALFRNRKNLRAGEWFWLAAALAMMVRLGRFAPIFGLIAGPALAATMPPLADRVLRRPIIWAMLVIGLSACVFRVVAGFPPASEPMDRWVNRRGPDVSGFPTAAADFVQKNVTPRSGRLINEFNWGGYLEWRFAGKYQTLLDGRTQIFSREFWQATYLGDEESRMKVLRDPGADAAILPVRKPLFRDAMMKLGWRSVYRDEFAEVLLPPSL